MIRDAMLVVWGMLGGSIIVIVLSALVASSRVSRREEDMDEWFGRYVTLLEQNVFGSTDYDEEDDDDEDEYQ